MCGRYTNTTSWADVHAFSQPLTLQTPADDPAPAWNIAPTQTAWVITADPHADGAAHPMRWGLVPGWANDLKIGASMINARCETAATKPAFRAAWRARRCLVPASGYYEWRPVAGGKQPYWIHPADGAVLMFAGVWEQWRRPDGEWLPSFAVLTRPAEGPLAELHDRTPLCLTPVQLQPWLSGEPADAAAIVADGARPALAWHAVGRAVGNVRNDGPQLIAPV